MNPARVKIVGETDRTGTTVTFKPDDQMFDTVEYDYETLHTRMREQAFLNAGLRITIEDKREGREQSHTMCYEGGIREFVTYINKNKTALHEEVIYGSRAAAAVRCRECLVQVHVDYVESDVRRTYDTDYSVQVGSVIVVETAGIMYEFCDFHDVRVEETYRIRVGQHQARGLRSEVSLV